MAAQNTDGKASPGSPFKAPPATIWNNMIDAGRAWANGRLDQPGQDRIRPRETDMIKIRNDSGAARRRGEILRIKDTDRPLTDLVDEHIWLKGLEPTEDGYFGILKDPAAIDGIEKLQVSGVCIALVDVTDETHKYAAAVATEYVLGSASSGPLEIIYKPDGTGEKECVVRFSGGSSPTLLYGIVNEDQTRGYYTVEIAEWAGTTPVEGEVPDICLEATGSTSASGDDSCADITLPAFESQLVGTGVYVLAYDPQSVLVPLEIGSDCILADMGATNATGSASASSGASEPVFQIVRGYQKHTIQYVERWACCNGTDTMVGRTPVVLVGFECAEATCAACE